MLGKRIANTDFMVKLVLTPCCPIEIVHLNPLNTLLELCLTAVRHLPKQLLNTKRCGSGNFAALFSSNMLFQQIIILLFRWYSWIFAHFLTTKFICRNNLLKSKTMEHVLHTNINSSHTYFATHWYKKRLGIILL